MTPNVRHTVPGAIRPNGEVHFGAFTLDLDTRELRRGPDSVLVENHPRALSKATLQEYLWPDTVVVDKNLANLVAEIRHALGDDPMHRSSCVRCIDLVIPSAGRSVTQRLVIASLSQEGGFDSPGGRRVDLVEGEHVLGRDPNVQLFLSFPGVSRRHALLRVEAATVTIEDLGSKNGTFVAGRQVDGPTTLADGDTIRLGSVELTLRALGVQGVTETW